MMLGKKKKKKKSTKDFKANMIKMKERNDKDKEE